MDNSWRVLEPSDQEMEQTQIRKWMFAHLEEHRDPKTGEINCTILAEACALELYPGEWLPETHIVWDEAVDVAIIDEEARDAQLAINEAERGWEEERRSTPEQDVGPQHWPPFSECEIHGLEMDVHSDCPECARLERESHREEE